MKDRDKKNGPAEGSGAAQPDAGPAGSTPPSEPPPPPVAPAEADSAVQAELDELMDRLKRTTADYQNYQKRVVKEIAEARRYANAELIKEILPVIDSLEKAMQASAEPAAASVLAGVKITHEHLLAVLGRHGVSVIDAAGQPFDPQLHEAMMRQPSADVPPMTVLTQLAKGYRMGERVLRPARVIVSAGPANESVE